MKTNVKIIHHGVNYFSISRINLYTLSMFYAQCDNKGSLYKLEVKVIGDVINSA
jgi:hypothetical protein